MTVHVGRTEPLTEQARAALEVRGFWPELNCHDVRAAIGFYGRTAGWRFTEVILDHGGSYWLGLDGDAPVCGIHPLDPALHAGIVAHWMNHVLVADLDSALRAALFRGARLMRPTFHVPGLGRLAVIADGAGALLGLMEPDAPLGPLTGLADGDAIAPLGHGLRDLPTH